jgi:CxxC motif-containing protein
MKEMICIVCPNSCRLCIEQTADSFKVRGNLCSRGEAFAVNEMTNPRRTVTSTVRTVFAAFPVLPVRTSRDIPKEKIRDLMCFLAGVTVQKALGIGDVVVKDALDLGIDVIASSNELKEMI